MATNGNIHVDVAYLRTQAANLMNIDEAINADMQSVMTILRDITASGEAGSIIEQGINQMSTIMSNLVLPADIAQSLIAIADQSEAQNDKFIRILRNWADGLGTIAGIVVPGVGAAVNNLSSVPEGAENYSFGNLISDVTQNQVSAMVADADYLNKFIYSTTGKTGMELGQEIVSFLVGAPEALFNYFAGGNASSISSSRFFNI